MDPSHLPAPYRRPYLHLLLSRLSVEAIPPGSPNSLATGIDYILSLKTEGKLSSDLEAAAKTIDPLLEELAAATSRERGTPCSFGEAAQIAHARVQAHDEQKHPWKKVLREAKEARKAIEVYSNPSPREPPMRTREQTVKLNQP